MRGYVAQASGKNQDVLHLHEERPLTVEDQQALALASQLVSQDSQMTFQQDQPGIMGLVQKVQQIQQNQMEQAMMADPTANMLLKTQMAETQRKMAEFQQQSQLDVAKNKQEYEIKVAQLEQKVQELTAKYRTQTELDAQRNATDIALANIKNAAKERIAEIGAHREMERQQEMLRHEQDLSAMEAIQTAENDIRQHGLAVRKQVFEQQAQQVQQAIDAQQSQQQHIQALQQAQQQHEQGLQQAAEQHAQQMQMQQQQQPPQEEQI